MDSISLNGIWKLSGSPQEGPGNEISLSATVPGCVQLDLADAGYLPNDLYMGENIVQAEKYETWQWRYERTFIAPKERENVYLVFEGVDCVAHYYLNGIKIGDSENMFISHEFCVGKYLIDGENTLCVHIESPVLAAHALDYTIDGFITSFEAPVNTGLRKAAHNYGWDIMPRAVTSGIWRDVRLEVRDKIYFSQMYFCANSSRCDFLYELACSYSDLAGIEIELEGACKDSYFHIRKSIPQTRGKAGHIPVSIENPYLWWPYGYGEANIYDATVRIYQNGNLIHTEHTHFGIRDVKLERTDITDGKTGCFRFLINNTEILCKGTNWVPMDAFHCRDATRYDTALALVKDIGCNIVRCWGGNVYEDHKFFDFCDRNGIMVWQDFSMACTVYPQDDRFLNLMRQEAQAVVCKLRQHPSIILWAGDNEVDILSAWYGVDPGKNRITREVLPQVIHNNDKYRPYLPSSPYISDAVYQTGNQLNCPEAHLWGPRDYFKSSYYKESLAHFISETGYHGCPSLDSIKKFITPEKVWPYQNNSEWILHSSNQQGNDSRVMLMEKQVKQLFGQVPSEPENYILASQISQAEAKKYFIERTRVGRPHKTGIIWWNLLDGWPQMSDAVVDYFYTKKVAYNYIKRAQAPFTVIADELDHWNITFYACNDTLTPHSGSYKIIDGETNAILLEGTFTAPVNTSTPIGKLPVYYSEHKYLLIAWDANGESGINHYVCGYPPLNLDSYKTFLQKYNL